jgi:hypothetical protein
MFGHREHLQLAWEHVRAGKGDEVGPAIRHVAAHEGALEKYHETITRFWVELVTRAVDAHAVASFDELLDRAPHLADKTLPQRHWSASRLASAEARATWVEPDLLPLP